MVLSVSIFQSSEKATVNVKGDVSGKLQLTIDEEGNYGEGTQDQFGTSYVYNGDKITPELIEAIQNVEGVVDCNSETPQCYYGAAVKREEELMGMIEEKLAGYAIVECSSGKHKGESHISYRGRKRLRYVLYEATISLIARNEEFKEIHRYYRTRKENPLKKIQSVIAVACKALRIFYTILAKGVTYDGVKMLQDIKRPQVTAA